MIKTTFLLLAMLILNISSANSADLKFTGTKSCVGCHIEQDKAWQGSHHDLAMQHATAETILGDFNTVKIEVNGVKSTFFKKGDEFWVNTDGKDGKLQDFRISYAFGVTPLQQYLIEFPDGRIQALGIAWDTRPVSAGGQRWFTLIPDETITAEDELHWTGRQQNWNYMCADCHSTDLNKGYNPSTDTFKTTWSDINVGCESCHGPGEKHLQWAGLDKDAQSNDAQMGLSYLLNDRESVKWSMNPATGTAERSPVADSQSNTETGVCAACHSRRNQFSEGIEHDGQFLNHYRPAFLTEDLYHDDGQIKDEVYVWGSFEQSKMRAAGVTCSDCHEPHSLELRAPQQQVCAQCHMPSRFDTPEHTGHQADSSGSNCLNCHMPAQTYMVVDPRRDHSMRIPRPDLSLTLGIPNACNQCHTDKTTEWAASEFDKHWPDAKMPFQSWTKPVIQARAGQQQAELSLLSVIRNEELPGLARATAISELGPFLSQFSATVLQTSLSDPSPLVRYASLGLLETIPPDNRYALAAPLLSDPVTLVRTEAARVSAQALQTPLEPQQRQVLEAALKEYIDGQLYNADRPEAYLNLGIVYSQSGDNVAAEKAYRQAIKLENQFAPAYVNLADLYRLQGMEQNAKQILTDGIKQMPEDASLYFALGLLQVRDQQLEAALVALQKAAEFAPELARYTYVYGVALNSGGQSANALKVLTEGHQQHPRDQQIIFMVASIYRDQGNKQLANEWAQKLLEINPADQNATRFIELLEQTQ
jgi:tetratricopeptide (TPR) repeat protein